MVTNVLSKDLIKREKEEYICMLSKFPNLFIAIYEEIRDFQREDLHIELKEWTKSVR